MKNSFFRSLGESALRGWVFWLSAMIFVWVVFAAGWYYSNLPTVSSSSTVSSTSWNALVDYVNKSVKQDTEVLSITGSTVNVSGQVQISGGSPSSGKVLISDATGLGSWWYQKTPFASTTSVATSIPNSVWTLLAMSDEFDPYNFFNPATNRFQPTIAGYYQVDATTTFGGAASAGNAHTLYFQLDKNSSPYLQTTRLNEWYAGWYTTALHLHEIVYLNGSSDYISFSFYDNSATGTANTRAHIFLISQ